MRKLVEVIDRMLPILKQNGVDASGLESIRKRVGYTAPEAVGARWQEAQDWLQEHANGTDAWHILLKAIWAGLDESTEAEPTRTEPTRLVIHELKTWSEPFALSWAGLKPYEVRDARNRDFKAGDGIVLREWVMLQTGGEYTGREIRGVITAVTSGAWGIPSDLAVLGIEQVMRLEKQPHWAQALQQPPAKNVIGQPDFEAIRHALVTR